MKGSDAVGLDQIGETLDQGVSGLQTLVAEPLLAAEALRNR